MYKAVPGLIRGVIDLIPLVGVKIAATIVIIVAFLASFIAGVVVLCFFLIYQQVENHAL